jgi:glycosyltransferase 2 family protein
MVEVTGQGRAEAAPSAAPAELPAPVSAVPEAPPEEPVREPVVHEPRPPRRIRQPVDLGRAIVALLGAALLVGLGEVAVGTTSGVEQDILGVSAYIPSWLLDVIAVVVVLGLLALPLIIAIDQVVRRRSPWILDELLAAALGFLLAYGLSLVLSAYASRDLLDALTRGEATDLGLPVAPFLAALVAFVSATGVAGRPRLQLLTYITFAGLILESLIGGLSTPLALLVTLLVGRAAGLGVRYALGTPNPRPGGAEIALALRRIGIEAAELRAVDPQVEDSRRYLVQTAPGRLYDVAVLDRDQQGAALVYRLWRRIRLRTPMQRRALLSLRAALEHEALLSYAATAAGARTPRLVGVSDVGHDAALLAYEKVPGRTLDEVSADEVTDHGLAQVWQQFTILASRRIVPRSLTADRLLLDDAGTLWLIDVRSGDVAASDLQIRLDAAQLLVTTALLVGTERALDAAVDAIGPEQVARALPLLQPIALSGQTRAELRQHRGLLTELRDAALKQLPQADVEPVQVERVRPRTLLTIVGGAVAAYILLSQLGSVDPVSIFSRASLSWALIALGFSALTYVAAALSLMGFVPQRLDFIGTFFAQVAGSFVKLVAPPAVGGVAVNARFVQRSGVDPALAVASVGLWQVFAFVFHVALLLLSGLITGSSASNELIPSRSVFYAVVAVVLILAAAFAVPQARRLLRDRVQPMLTRIIPRLLDMLQTPTKLALGIGGNLLLTAAFVLCLYASIQAFGETLPIWSIAVVYLAGSALGSAAPTPGGLGAVEAALSAGLTAAGLPGATAVSAVLLFRLVTFWLPVLPGWLCFTALQRRGAI